jgi:CDP-diglyceride synthetase
MFRNDTECHTGIMTFQYNVQNAEVQKEKYFYGEKLRLLNGTAINAPCAEVLRMIEGSNLEEDGWIARYARFGSVMTSVYAALHFKANSTWTVKTNTVLYPMEALHSVLWARFGNKKAGHWVVFKIMIVGVYLISVAYAWSQRGVSYFVSSCGNTATSLQE